MYKDPPAGDRINSFALVSYIPDPLASFLDKLRQELVPNCFLRAHVTVLPPRPISSSPEAAWRVVQALTPLFQPFEVELTEVEIFPISDVIYINISTGRAELIEMHDAMNVDGLYFRESFPYSPHITLAQDLQPDEVDELVRVARVRWKECSFPTKFSVDKALFVQNTRRNQWIDLGESRLGYDESKLVGELMDLVAG
jgi:2'-5' RNA ligase